ncbi:MAG: hypothetical protein LBS96_08305 [Oscillospiraceae bacterium]|jgi:hypothetical protein|nr:hypothetical protein [Oscillospiraceae bacterium]
MQKKPYLRKLLAALLCLAAIPALLSACGSVEAESTTSARPTLPPTTLADHVPITPEPFSLAKYKSRADAAAADTNQMELSGMYSEATFTKANAGEVWVRAVTDATQRNWMQASQRTIYLDEANDVFLIIGTPDFGETRKETCYLLLQKSTPKVLAAWVEK